MEKTDRPANRRRAQKLMTVGDFLIMNLIDWMSEKNLAHALALRKVTSDTLDDHKVLSTRCNSQLTFKTTADKVERQQEEKTRLE